MLIGPVATIQGKVNIPKLPRPKDSGPEHQLIAKLRKELVFGSFVWLLAGRHPESANKMFKAGRLVRFPGQ